MSIPCLMEDGGGKYLVVDGKPFLALGGELHNSSGSDLEYMDRVVWPALRRLGGNFYLTPAYWDLMEPEEGVYDFTLVDGIIAQARREGVHLGILWFGAWKNGTSDYVPLWLKADKNRFTIVVDENGKPIYQPRLSQFYTMSPLSEELKALDAKAFAALMRHLKEVDGEETTVIMMQVENEVGVWGGIRDYSAPSEKMYRSEVPAEVAARFNVSGTWKEAFGENAPNQMMAYQYAKYVDFIAAAGKAEYPLPMYVNAVVGGGSFAPAGGPDGRSHEMWKAFAPHIDWLSPDLYAPDFKGISGEFVRFGNPFFVPETGGGKNSAGNFIYAMGARNCIGFNPFAIERLFMDNEYYEANPNTLGGGHPFPERHGEGQDLKKAYEIGQVLFPELRKAFAEGRVKAFLQQDSDPKGMMMRGPQDYIEMQDYRFAINYGFSASSPFASNAAGLIIERGKDEFLLFAVNCLIDIKPLSSEPGDVFVTDKHEWYVKDGKLLKGRSLNGDERAALGAGNHPQLISFRLEYMP